MKQQFLSALQSLSLPSLGKRTLYAGVSGGRDSMCMLDLLRRLLPEAAPGMRMVAVHCNFSLRGEESDSDEALVRDYCLTHSVPLEYRRFDTATYARQNGLSVEMAARTLRYSYFASLCRNPYTGNVEGAMAVAHNANDNAETLLLNLVRGTGIEGICGMRTLSAIPVLGGEDIPLLRPLLPFSREQITSYVKEEGVPFHDDRTNADTKYRRNKIRSEVLPVLGELNPSILGTLSREMEHFSQVRDIAREYFKDHLDTFCRSLAEGVSAYESVKEGLPVEVDIAALRKTPHFQFILYNLLSPYGFNESQLDSCLSILESGAQLSGKTLCSQLYSLSFTTSSFRIEPLQEDILQSEVPFDGEGQYSLGRDCTVRVEKVKVDEVDYTHPPVGVLYMDLAGVNCPLVLRHWREGDWMRPLGMGGRKKKLSDIFPSLGLDVMGRKRIPLLCVEGSSEVLSIIGHRIAETVRIDESTLLSTGGAPVFRVQVLGK